MKILVFDDNATHRAAAKAQLKDHDLTVVGTYDEAQELLTPQFDYKKASAIIKGQFGDFNPYDSDNEVMKVEYIAAIKVANEQATTYPDFDVVLTDLLVPASSQSQGNKGRAFVGQESPVGIFIGLLAAIKGRAKYAAVFTDSNHHEHPASACFDVFNEGEGSPTPFTVNGCRVIMSNTRNWVGDFDPNDLSKRVAVYNDLPDNMSPNQRHREWTAQGKIVSAKDWAALLDYLVNYDEKK